MAERKIPKDSLQRNWGRLKSEVTYGTIADELIEKSLITVDDNIRIRNFPCERQRMEEVLHLLHRSPKDWTTTFCQILDKNKYSYIVEELQKAADTSKQLCEDKTLTITAVYSGRDRKEFPDNDKERKLLTEEWKKEFKKEITNEVTKAVAKSVAKELAVEFKTVLAGVSHELKKKEQKLIDLDNRIQRLEISLKQERVIKCEFQAKVEALMAEKKELEKELNQVKMERDKLNKRNKKLEAEMEKLKENNLKQAYRKPCKLNPMSNII